MKKFLSFSLLTPLFLFLAANPVFAQCTVNGQEVPCDQFFHQFGWILALTMIIPFICFGFWIWMLIDCLKRDFKDKLLWVIVIVFLNVIGALLYFFLVKRKNKSASS